MSQVTSESILTTKAIVEQAIKDYHKQILPYLNGEFPTAVAERFAEGNIYTTDEKIIGQWIDGKPLYQCVLPPNSHVPVLTDVDSRVIQSAQQQAAYAGWKVFDGNPTTFWDPGKNTGRVGWDFQSAVPVLKIKFGMFRPGTYPITTFDLCYSDDATNWTVVHSYVMGTDYEDTSKINEFTVQEDVGDHRYWSLYVTCAKGWAEVHTVDFICVEMPSDAELIITKDLANGNIISQYTKVGDDPVSFGTDTYYSTTEKIIGTWIDGTPIYQIVRDTPFSDVSLIPTMSSNTSDVCEVSSIGDYQSNYSYKAFDNDDATYWSSTTNNYGYLNVHFFTAQTVAKIGLKPRKLSAYASVKDFEIWGSNDNFVTHDVLLSATCQNSSDTQNFDLTTMGRYSYYRLNVLNCWTTDAMSASVVQLNLIGKGQSDITILDTRILNGKYVYQYIKTTD